MMQRFLKLRVALVAAVALMPLVLLAAFDFTVCLYTQATGETSEVSFQKLAPFLTDLWVSFALDLKFTVGAFAVLLALLRSYAPWDRHVPSAGNMPPK